jgi:hypothetical protein
MDTPSIDTVIQSLEDRRYQAMLEGDAEALDVLLSDRLLYTHSSGSTDSKASYMRSIREGTLRYRKIELQDPRIEIYAGAALVAGRAELDASINGVRRMVTICYLSVWMDGGSGWQLAAFQSTPAGG